MTADDLLFTRELTVAGERASAYSRVRGRELVKLHPGVYVQAAEWDAADIDERYRMLVLAFDRRSPGRVLSHESAAALWRLPSLPPWPDRVHVLVPAGRVARSTVTSVAHVGPDAAVVTIDGAMVTSLARTVVDLARTRPFADAVVVADAALRRAAHPLPGMPVERVDLDALRRELDAFALRQGTAAALHVIEFADGRADRPGESLSRVTMHRAGIPKPELQTRLVGLSGRRYPVDFWWPEFDAIGEFDGRYKYSDPRFLSGRTPEQALYDEKLREDDLRAVHRGFARWNFAVAASVPRLRDRLAAAGVR